MRKILTFLPLILIPLFLNGQIKSSIDGVSGVSYSYRTLNVTDDDGSLAIVKSVRDNAEKPKLNWRIGLNYNQMIARKFGIKIGVRLMSVGYILKNTSQLQWGTQHNGMGGWTPDPSLPQFLKLTENYLFIEVPIVLRYQITKGRFHPFIEAGVAPSFYLTTRRIVDYGGSKEVEYESFDSGHFNTIQYVSVFSIGLGYDMKKGNQLFLQPTFRYHLTKMAKAPVSENLFNMGIELGYRIMLKKTDVEQ